VCETDVAELPLELNGVFLGVGDVVFGVAEPAAVEPSPAADVVAALGPPVAVLPAPEITPVYVALNADTAATTLDGSGAIVPPLYLLHCEEFNSLRSVSAIPHVSSQ